MVLFFALGIPAVLAMIVVWRLGRSPVRGDVQVQLLWRGALAGITGEVIGVSLSSLLWPPNAFWYLGYFYWLLVNIVLGLIFTPAVWGVQKMTSGLNVPGRASAGAAAGTAAAWGWASWAAATQVYHDEPADAFGKSIVALIVITGAVSGILAGPLQGEKKAP
jgi:hypothetical protein